jgi:hypothetical protein
MEKSETSRAMVYQSGKNTKTEIDKLKRERYKQLMLIIKGDGV